MTDETRIKLEAYLEHKMSPEEVVLFEEQLAKDSQLREELHLYKEMQLFFKEEDSDFVPDNTFTKDLRSFIKSEKADFIQKQIGEVHEEYVNKRKKRRRIFPLAAAIIVIIIASSITYSIVNGNSKTIFDNYYTAKDLPSVISRGADENSLTQGILEFQKKNYLQAISIFEKITANKENNIPLALYLGVSYMQVEKYDKALIEFDKVIFSDAIDRTKGLWFKALLYLKKEDHLKAKEVLNKIKEDPRSFKQKEAKELLSKL